jgi:PAS domain S-box-containing protein
MPFHPPAASVLRQKRFIPLRYRFVAVTTALLVLVLGLLALSLGYWQSQTIKRRLEERGQDIAGSLSATAVTTLINYNYVALEQVANEAAQDPGIVYVVVHDKEGRVAGYSGRPDLQHEFLDDAVSRNAITSTRSLTQVAVLEDARYPLLDVAVPVIASQSDVKWGTIRVGLSFEAIYRQVRQMITIIMVIGVLALCFGIVVAFWAARRITRPLKRLVGATVEATRGTLRRDIDIHTSDEIEILAENFSSMMRDILKHKETLESQLSEIQHMQKYTNKLLTTMNDGLLSFDMDGKVHSINPAACQLLGLPESRTVEDASIWAMTDDRDRLQRYIRQKMANPGRTPHEEIHLNRQGGEQILIVGSSVLESDAGVPEEVILNLHDVTEQKKMEARIRQAERLAALGTLAAGMAHEIRNPLSAIKTFVQLLPRKLSKPGFLGKFNRTVPREINRINQLVEELLDLARKPRYDFSLTDIGALLLQNLELLEEELAAQKVELRFRRADGLPPVPVDKNQLNKAIQNLVRNALQAMPGGGVLTVETLLHEGPSAIPAIQSNNGRWVSIAFEDTGVGIDPEMINTIFNPFFTSKDQGTGLGLAITHKVISEHGGHIEVSGQMGRGARFTVYLKAPLTEP